jgi:enoyl-CoA hydratase
MICSMLHSMGDIMTEQRGGACILTLDRPQTLNALTLQMVQDLHTQLAVAEANPACKTIIITSSADKAFCAGGDVRAVARYKGSPAIGALFFKAEYTLNYAIASCKKPVVVLVDGLCLGGGMGLAVHAAHCVATERASFAMPEMTIGLFPDIGAGYFLTQLPDGVGLWLALTGARLTAAQALALGLVKHLLESRSLPELIKRFEKEEAATVLASAAQTPRPSAPLDPITLFGAWIPAFAALTDISMLAELQTKQPELVTGSPTSLAVTLQHMLACKGLPLRDVLTRDYRLACGFLRSGDFYEGVRAQLIDKDKRPRWQPARLAEVTQALIDRHLATPFGGALFES